jgi:hypothetical protein
VVILAGDESATAGPDGEATLHLPANAPVLALAGSESGWADDEVSVAVLPVTPGDVPIPTR